jgi:6-phosphogluconate dehydrogenase
VKMVHNGIEYIDMQLIGEAYFLIRNLFNVRPNELAEIFARWNEGDLDPTLFRYGRHFKAARSAPPE